jgi:hypothetical protein
MYGAIKSPNQREKYMDIEYNTNKSFALGLFTSLGVLMLIISAIQFGRNDERDRIVRECSSFEAFTIGPDERVLRFNCKLEEPESKIKGKPNGKQRK